MSSIPSIIMITIIIMVAARRRWNRQRPGGVGRVVQNAAVDRVEQISEASSNIAVGIGIVGRAAETRCAIGDQLVADRYFAGRAGKVALVEEARALDQARIELFLDRFRDVRRLDGLRQVDEFLIGKVDEFVRRR